MFEAIRKDDRIMMEFPTPCHIIDLDVLRDNLNRISRFKELARCDVYLAVKGFSAPYLFGEMKSVLDGISASGLFEARLGRENFGKCVQTYSPAFKDEHFEKVIKYSDTIVFNSITQFYKFEKFVRQKGKSCGIRINPLFSGVKKHDADPCREYSHLGIPITNLSDNTEIFEHVDGIHIHAMCEQNADSLERLTTHVVSELGNVLHKLKWLNLGGGQMIGHCAYEIERAAKCLRWLSETYNLKVILEPCEGIFAGSGYFATRVLDIFNNDGKIAILDASPVCHMQDALFRGWSRDIIGEAANGIRYRLCGQTCFAGDTFGWYSFEEPLKVGDILYFKDTATYTWVKNNSFNGIPFPSICTYSKDTGIKVVREYKYDDFFRTL